MMAVSPAGHASKNHAGAAILRKRLGTYADQELGMPLCVQCSTQTSYTGKDLDMYSQDSPYKCPICADPRSFIGFQGQKWTTLSALHAASSAITEGYHNAIEEITPNKLWAITTRPKFGIGQRAFLISDSSNAQGLVMWDCIAYIDDATLEFIDGISQGQGIKHLVVSHPHFYSTTAVWAAVYPGATLWVAKCDFKDWYQRRDLVDATKAASTTDRSRTQNIQDKSLALQIAQRTQLVDNVQTLLPNTEGRFTILKLGGHFPGSLVLLHEDMLFLADTIQIVPSGMYKSEERQREGVPTFSFMWSYPNLVPLSAAEVERVCAPLQDVHFEKAFGGFEGLVVWGHAKEKVFQSRDIILARLAAD